MVKSVWPQEEKIMRPGRRMLIILTVPIEQVITCWGPWGSARTWSGGRRQEWGESQGHSLHWGFHRKGKAGQEGSLRLAGFNHPSRCWTIGWSLSAWPLEQRARRPWLGVWESDRRWLTLVLRNWLVCVWEKGCLLSFSTNKALGAAVSPQPPNF